MVTNQWFFTISILDMHWSVMLVNLNSVTNSIISMNVRSPGHVLECVPVAARITFTGFQIIAGNAVPLCHIFYADKAGAQKHCTGKPRWRHAWVAFELGHRNLELLPVSIRVASLSSTKFHPASTTSVSGLPGTMVMLPAASRRLGLQHRVGPYPSTGPGHCNHSGRRPDR